MRVPSFLPKAHQSTQAFSFLLNFLICHHLILHNLRRINFPLLPCLRLGSPKCLRHLRGPHKLYPGRRTRNQQMPVERQLLRRKPEPLAIRTHSTKKAKLMTKIAALSIRAKPQSPPTPPAWIKYHLHKMTIWKKESSFHPERQAEAAHVRFFLRISLSFFLANLP